MDSRFVVSRATGALASLLLAAACSVERAPTAVAPPGQAVATDRSVALSVKSAEHEDLDHAVIHPTVDATQAIRALAKGKGKGGSPELFYNGGIGGIGVETAPRVYLVFWGSQWSDDPSSEAALVQSFLSSVGGSSWLNSVTQYCQDVAANTVYCNGAGTAAGNPKGILVGVWFDNAAAAPSKPHQSQIATEAVNAAAHFGNGTTASNTSAQYVIATSHGNNSMGFGSQYCAYHSSTSSSYGDVAYTNLPYITDAGASCGAGFNNLGPNAGITIVEGHELAETISDQFPDGGWLDSQGEEIGDKCVWIASGQGAIAAVKFGNASYPVQSLWSNVFDSGAGGCVQSYP